MKTRASNAPALIAALLLAAAGLCGCGLLRSTVEAPGKVASAIFDPGGKGKPVDPNLVQARFMRYADIFATEITNATREFGEATNTPEGRIQALQWRVDYTNALWRLASGQRPFAAMFDGIVMITFVRSQHQERWLKEWGEPDRAVLDALVRLEESVWGLAGEALSEEHLREVRGLVEEWLAGDPAGRIADVARLPGFADLAGSGKKEEGSLLGEVTGLMTIDPLAGLEPAVRQLEQGRQLAERVFYYLQRMPEILSGRVEILAQRSIQTQQVRDTLDSVERVSQAAASIAATAEALPENFAAEREAALAQLSAELTAQREGLIRDLETARDPLTELLEKTRGTAVALDQMSQSIAGGANALDAFVGRFDKGEDGQGGSPEAANADGEQGGVDGSGGEGKGEEGGGEDGGGGGFDITEYGDSAERIGIAARELTATIVTLDNSLPKVRQQIEEVGERVDRSVDHVFARALQLLAAALAGVTLTILLVRWLSPRARAGQPAER